MKPRWKVTLAAITLASLFAFAFVLFFSGINLENGMVIEGISRKGVRWVSLDGNQRDSHVEPLLHFLGGAAFLMAVVWGFVAAVMAPAGYLVGCAWERWRARGMVPPRPMGHGTGKRRVRAVRPQSLRMADDARPFRAP